MIFDSECRLCPRLAGFLDQVKTQYPAYYAKPVPPFGDEAPKLLIVGLAPGMHGANRTGRPFTGDYAGILLYETLHKYGFATAAQSVSADDGLRLTGCRISNAVKCLPPENKPTGDEINTCNRYLANEIATLPLSTIILALGNVAHLAVMKALKLKPTAYKFGHAARHVLPSGHVLYDSYHCSRYNTQTRRLTAATFHQVFELIRNEAVSNEPVSAVLNEPRRT
ncbi:MAG TPA: uracil-DNA glycosylase [Methylophilaceae bacterium]|nr:uracil-DNA glycosylase [Methylophilaceae bacterium]